MSMKRPMSRKVQDCKEALLRLPPGTPRPRPNVHPLGTRLHHYLTKSDPNYDPQFEEQVRLMHPEWLTPLKERSTAAIKKATLLALPPNSQRPKYNTILGRALSNYTTPSLETFDADFRMKIRERFSSWFHPALESRKARRKDLSNKHSQGVQLRKQTLMAMPLLSQRPDKNTPLGRVLTAYTSPSHRKRFDPEFLKQISQRFPHWFR